MKKYFGFVLVAVLSAASVLVFSELVKNNKEPAESSFIDNSDANQANIYQTKFNPAKAVIGPDFRIAAKKSVDAVVHIRSQFIRKKNRYNDFFGDLRDFFERRNYNRSPEYTPFVGYGSGVIISRDGYIVTNNHVVEGSSKIEVTLNDKRLYEAELIGSDPNTDLALIKIKEKNLPFLVYGNSDNLDIGEWVLAVGNPFNLTSTVTAGIVSAKARNINILGSQTAIESFIQTDAVVNRGNSGGALVDNDGYLVGINAAIASQTGTYEGYSFAIPVNIVKKIVDDLKKYGEVQRAFMGIRIREIDADFAKEEDIEQLKGVYVASVENGSGADNAGLKNGDIILRIDGIDVNSSSKLLEVVGQHRPGDKINVVVLRDSKQKVFDVVLQNAEGNTKVVKREANFTIEKLGAIFEQASSAEKNRLGIKQGLKIIELKDGLFKNGGIRKGFIVLKINGQPMNSKQDVTKAISDVEDDLLRVEGIYPGGMRIIYGFEW